MKVLIPRYCESYGFWEFDWREGTVVGRTHRGNLIVKIPPVSRGIFHKDTGICVNKTLGPHVPERFRRMRLDFQSQPAMIPA